MTTSNDFPGPTEAEATLQRMAALLEHTGQLAKVGGWELDLRSLKLSWTRETFRIAEIDSLVEPPLADGINLFAPEVRPTIAAAVQAATDSGTPYDLELPIITAKGRHRWVRTQGYATMENGKAIVLRGTFQDITERKRAELFKNNEREILEFVARGGPLPEVLTRLVRCYEALFPGTRGSVLLLDASGRHLRHGAAPSLPPAFCQAIDGVAIGPRVGSCGTAAY